jgi:hypothetical protein
MGFLDKRCNWQDSSAALDGFLQHVGIIDAEVKRHRQRRCPQHPLPAAREKGEPLGKLAHVRRLRLTMDGRVDHHLLSGRRTAIALIG